MNYRQSHVLFTDSSIRAAQIDRKTEALMDGDAIWDH